MARESWRASRSVLSLDSMMDEKRVTMRVLRLLHRLG